MAQRNSTALKDWDAGAPHAIPAWAAAWHDCSSATAGHLRSSQQHPYQSRQPSSASNLISGPTTV